MKISKVLYLSAALVAVLSVYLFARPAKSGVTLLNVSYDASRESMFMPCKEVTGLLRMLLGNFA